jgi:drug/metabolite transporter (DMT)-like permease
MTFAAVSVLWGIPYLFIRIAVKHGFPPADVAWARVVLATVVLLAVSARAGTLGSLRGRWPWLITYGIVEVVIPFSLIAFGEERVASSLAAIIIATVPLIGAVLALRFDPSEKPTPMRAAGMLVGFVGVIVLVGIDIAGSSRELLGVAGILVAAVGYAIGPMIVKLRFQGLEPAPMMGGSLLVAAVVLTPLAIIDLPRRAPTTGAVLSVVVLGLFCTALAFAIMTVLIREAGTGRAMIITYVNPVIALALGVFLLGERPGTASLFGLLLILVGSWISTGGRRPRRGRGRGAREASRSVHEMPGGPSAPAAGLGERRDSRPSHPVREPR